MAYVSNVISLILSIFGLVNNLRRHQVVVTDFTFRLCYISTSACLLVFSSLIGLKGTFGEYKIQIILLNFLSLS